MVKIARTLLDARLGLVVSRSSYCILLAEQAAETKGHAPLIGWVPHRVHALILREASRSVADFGCEGLVFDRSQIDFHIGQGARNGRAGQSARRH